MEVRKLNLRIAGMLIGMGAIFFVIALFVSEVLYPGYSVSNNYISDLGVGPSAIVFNFSVAFLGLLIIGGSYFLYKGLKDKIFTALVFLAGAGAVGVGVFNESFGSVHLIVSFIVFLFGGLSAIYFGAKEKSIIRYPSVVLGAVDLSALALFTSNVYLGLGAGGMERMIVYPVLLWAVLFSGRLLTL